MDSVVLDKGSGEGRGKMGRCGSTRSGKSWRTLKSRQ